ncbi:Hypothetical predicted protein, partial [Olea europaea subsp. europaea]
PKREGEGQGRKKEGKGGATKEEREEKDDKSAFGEVLQCGEGLGGYYNEHLYNELKDGSNLTEEFGLPTFFCIPTASFETESTENSSKRKRNSIHELFENWDPQQLQAVLPNPDDEDWLFQEKSQNIHSDKRHESCHNSIFIPRSSTLWPQAQFLSEADIYALPFTVPF